MPAKRGNLSKQGAPNRVYMGNCVLLLTVFLRRNMLVANALLIDNFTKRYQTSVHNCELKKTHLDLTDNDSPIIL